MPTVTASAQIGAGAEEMFNFLADYRNIPRIQPQFTSARLLTEQDRGIGATVALEGRFHGFPMQVNNRIIAFAPPHRLVSVSEGTITSRSTWELYPTQGGTPKTNVTLTVDYKFAGSLGGLFMGMGSALWPLLHREIKGLTDDSLKRLQGFFG